LRTVFSFLRRRCSVPHLRLLPRMFIIETLGRFFALHPEPNSRTQELLSRWVWRVFLNEGRYEERSLRRKGVAEVEGKSEEAAVQVLLGLVPREPATPSWPATFDARAAKSRLALLAMSWLRPLGLVDGHAIDVAAFIDEQGAGAFRAILPVRTPMDRSLRA